MKQKLTMFILTTILLMSFLYSNILAAENYNFGNDYKTDTFGNPTTSQTLPDNSQSQNIRRNKDGALYPPSYGKFSGDFDTDPTNPYVTSDVNKSGVTKYPAVSTPAVDNSSGFIPSTSVNGTSTNGTGAAPANNGSFIPTNSSNSNINVTYTTSNNSSNTVGGQITSVAPYSDGSIGSVQIPNYGVNVKVFESVELSTLKIGVGHFTSTSQWDGNVALASHNRGGSDFFNCVKDMKIGDKIKYTTKEGTRTYVVYCKKQIDETDMSDLSASNDNILTLITCVMNDPPHRWCLQAREVK